MTRYKKVQELKKEKKDLLKSIGISVSSYKRNLPKVKGYGKNYEVIDVDVSPIGSHIPSLAQQVEILRKLKDINSDLQTYIEENKKFVKQDKTEQK